jgi:hypothetical protein
MQRKKPEKIKINELKRHILMGLTSQPIRPILKEKP